MLSRVSGLLVPLAEHPFRLLWLAQLTSETGDWAARLALSLLVFDRTGSPVATTTVLAASFLPWLGAGQLLASLADGRPRQRVMVASDLLRALLFCVMALPLPLPAILGLVFLSGIASAPFSAARAALLPRRRLGPALPGLGHPVRNHQRRDRPDRVPRGRRPRRDGGRTDHPRAQRGDVPGVGRARLPGSLGASRDNQDSVPRRLRQAAAFLWRSPLRRRAILLGTIPAASAAAVETLVVVYAGGRAEAAGIFAAVLPAAAMAVAPLLPTSGSNDRLLRAGSVLGLTGGGTTLVCFLLLPVGTSFGALGFAGAGVLFAVLMPANTVVERVLPTGVRASSFGLLMGIYMAGQAAGALGGGVLAEHFGVRVATVLAMVPALASTVACWRPWGAGDANASGSASGSADAEPPGARRAGAVGYARGA